MRTTIIFSLFVFIFTSCGDRQIKTPPDIRREGKASKEEIRERLEGQWEAETLGKLLGGYGFTLPARFIFTGEGTYIWIFRREGKIMEARGKYKIIRTVSAPYTIDLYQEKIGVRGEKPEDRPLTAAGLFGFLDDGRLKILFYNRSYFPRAEDFSYAESQIYQKVEKEEKYD
jgi:hypothetical protein